MCEPRYWKSIYSTGSMTQGIVSVVGTRSDGKLFRVQSNPNKPVTPLTIAALINRFEEFRSCNCETDKECTKHKEKNKPPCQ